MAQHPLFCSMPMAQNKFTNCKVFSQPNKKIFTCSQVLPKCRTYPRSLGGRSLPILIVVRIVILVLKLVAVIIVALIVVLVPVHFEARSSLQPNNEPSRAPSDKPSSQPSLQHSPHSNLKICHHARPPSRLRHGPTFILTMSHPTRTLDSTVSVPVRGHRLERLQFQSGFLR